MRRLIWLKEITIIHLFAFPQDQILPHSLLRLYIQNSLFAIVVIFLIIIHMGKKNHHKEKKERDYEGEEEPNNPPEKIEEPQQTKQEEGSQVVAPKKVSYCPVCSLTFQLCKYGKQAIDCAIFLYKLAPAKVSKYHPNFKPEEVDLTKHSKVSEEKQGKGKEESKAKGIKDKYVVIDVKNRGRKNYVTTVTGLNNFGIDCKELSKKCSKKFAVSCSAIDQGSVQLQGDNFQAMKDFLLAEYKQLLKKKYIIDKDDFNQKVAEQKAKNKEARKQQKNVIKEEPEEEGEGQDKQKPEPEKNKNQIRLQMMKEAEKELNSDDEEY